MKLMTNSMWFYDYLKTFLRLWGHILELLILSVQQREFFLQLKNIASS